MKTLFAIAALATAIASPALAQPTKHHHAVRAHHVRQASPDWVASRRYMANPNAAYDVEGEYLGSDPDPTVREEIARDSGAE